MEIRALRENDDRTQFPSGDPDLDRFFHKFAGQNQFKHYVGVTYVAVEERCILGFATIAPGHLEIDGLPAAARKKLPRYQGRGRVRRNMTARSACAPRGAMATLKDPPRGPHV
jgi:hypothetical protein